MKNRLIFGRDEVTNFVKLHDNCEVRNLELVIAKLQTSHSVLTTQKKETNE